MFIKTFFPCEIFFTPCTLVICEHKDYFYVMISYYMLHTGKVFHLYEYKCLIKTDFI